MSDNYDCGIGSSPEIKCAIIIPINNKGAKNIHGTNF